LAEKNSYFKLLDTNKTTADKFVSYKISVKEMEKTITLQSTILCPVCGFRKEEIIPTDACVFFYERENCKIRLKPKEGDCCVFCSYGTVECPPKQMDLLHRR